MTEPLVELSSIVKSFGGLRPLRIEHLLIVPRERTAIVGIDRPSAEVLVNVMTGTALPDSGVVSIFGRDSAAITESDEWLSLVDRFGIVTPRAVLLEELSVAQNLAVPFSLDIEPLAPALREQAIAAGREAALPESCWDTRASALSAADRLRLRIARSLALDPAIVLLEHPTAGVPRDEAAPLAKEIRSLIERREIAAVALTADPDFAAAFAGRVLRFDPATGRLSEGRRGWFGLGG